MGAYNNMDKAVPGLKQGLGGRIEAVWACAEANGIAFGNPVFAYEGDEKKVYNFHVDTGKLVFAGDLITANSMVVTVNGVATDPVVFANDHATTMGFIVDELNSLDGVEAVLDSSDVNSRTIIIRTKGATAVVTAVVTLGETQTTATFGSKNSGQVFVGVAMYLAGKVQSDIDSNVGFEFGDNVLVMADGQISVTASVNVEANTDVYITTAGLFGIAGTKINARYRESVSATGLVEIDIKGQTTMTNGSLI